MPTADDTARRPGHSISAARSAGSLPSVTTISIRPGQTRPVRVVRAPKSVPERLGRRRQVDHPAAACIPLAPQHRRGPGRGRRPAAERDDRPLIPERSFKGSRLRLSERRLSVPRPDFTHAGAAEEPGGLIIQVDERPSAPGRHTTAHGALAGPPQPDQHDRPQHPHSLPKEKPRPGGRGLKS
jgi:hypothetical protein